MKRTRRILAWLILAGTFALPDVWLRVMTRWIGAYSIYELAPNLFTFLWSLLLAALVTVPASRRVGRCLYGIFYGLFVLYAVVQYGAYLILDRFLYVSDFMLAGEGADYASWVFDVLNPSFLLQAAMLIAVGVLGIAVYPEPEASQNRRLAVRVAAVVLCLLAMVPVPRLYGDADGSDRWDGFSNLALEYERFTNPNVDMELTGLHQYLFRDVQIQVDRHLKDWSEEIELLDIYFAQQPEHAANEMTGLLAGKNVIVVMMETMDDWMITREDTPTLYRMMHEGINFSNFYTPGYASGYTFNTEFAFHTGTYPYANGNTAYSLARNTFSNSIAAQFAAVGYGANSFHEGTADFYNRGSMHHSWGYERYHSYQDYAFSDLHYLDDRYLTECDDLYGDLIAETPFFSFVISYTPHLPYTDDDLQVQTALKLYPQYDVETDREVALLRAKARLTDDMFAGLLERLEEDGLLEDTVIVGFGDHYAYGLSDAGKLQELSDAAGSSILERTPAFVYCAGCGLSMNVSKTMQVTDLAPTILNLFGLQVSYNTMGRDVFDDTYNGLVVFSNNGWLTDTTYVRDGVLVWNHGMTDEEIARMNDYIQQAYRINDAILDSDYYSHRQG